jgi:hypothetical protein
MEIQGPFKISVMHNDMGGDDMHLDFISEFGTMRLA